MSSIANIEMMFILSSVLLRFDFDLVSDKLETIERFQHEPHSMKVRIRRRGKMEA